MASMLKSKNDTVLLGRRNTRKHSGFFHDMLQSAVGHSLDFVSQNHSGGIDSYLFADMAGHEFVIAGHYFDLNTILPKCCDGSCSIRTGRISKREISCQYQS